MGLADSGRVICASADLADGGPGRRFLVTLQGRDEPAFVIRHGGQVHAYVNRCAHVPVELDWAEGEFFDHSGLYLICATHGAHYFPESGRCAGGPCRGRGLEKLEVAERDGLITLMQDLNDDV
ncbi:MAG: Rieske 2Fe-2S domain-containing protein [Betaproteobacteria bacterium]|jgi:nitrite reductase/ring-hydroxylating ferredoxin subunit